MEIMLDNHAIEVSDKDLCFLGFELKNGDYCRSLDIVDGQFELDIIISDGAVTTRVTDKTTDEPSMSLT